MGLYRERKRWEGERKAYLLIRDGYRMLEQARKVNGAGLSHWEARHLAEAEAGIANAQYRIIALNQRKPAGDVPLVKMRIPR